MSDLLDIDDLSAEDLAEILKRCAPGAAGRPLAGQGAALVFEKPSARTRNSMEMAVVQLGGHPVTIRPDEIGIDTRESAEDVARTLACYHAVIGARVFDHEVLSRMATAVDVPVVNMLSDRSHPLQAIADVLTIRGEFGTRDDVTVAYVGDANNVARSLVVACLLNGLAIRVASPEDFAFTSEDQARFAAFGSGFSCGSDPRAAVNEVQVVYTDVWTSMGQEQEARARREAFRGFGVDQTLFSTAASDAIFLHCLPAHRGEEVAADVVDGPASRVWQQAENRMHAARGALSWMVDQ